MQRPLPTGPQIPAPEAPSESEAPAAAASSEPEERPRPAPPAVVAFGAAQEAAPGVQRRPPAPVPPTTEALRRYAARRVYEATPLAGAGVALRLADRSVELGPTEAAAYAGLVEWLPTVLPIESVQAATGLGAARLGRVAAALADAGLFYLRPDAPEGLTGEELHREVFTKVLPSWLAQAFSHPFWDRMMSGQGSARLFTGWLIELYHYTRNANRHMPLACAHARSKPIKVLRARHYAEEWNHYHYFITSLKALGFTEESITASVPLPMTLALSNFMRQAAREDVLAYSICSAVLEGTTVDRDDYGAYYEKAKELYGVPAEAIAPIYAHLALDVQYGHADLFQEILGRAGPLPAERVARVLDYGHQLVEHIWMWTENIESYYGAAENEVPRRPFDPRLD